MEISKSQFYRGGGFANPRTYRRMVGNLWTYWQF